VSRSLLSRPASKNLGDSKRARARKELDRRIAAPLHGGAKFVPVLSRKGGVGKTTVVARDDVGDVVEAADVRLSAHEVAHRLAAGAADAVGERAAVRVRIDGDHPVLTGVGQRHAEQGRHGRLADAALAREHRHEPSGKTVRDLVRAQADVRGFNDISDIVARDHTRLDILESDTDPHVSEAFSDDDYRSVAEVAAHFYSVVLTDTGTGIVHSVMGATLERADDIVVVAGLSVDEARLASETLTWLETNGFADLVRRAVVVLNTARPC
jgi:hypothetical protein